jgi:hypothetical protein
VGDTPRKETIRFFLAPQLDVQRREHANILFLRDPRAICVQKPEQADYIIMDMLHLYSSVVEHERYPRVTYGTKYIIMNLGDLYHWMVGLRYFDGKYRDHIAKMNAKFFVFTCETEPYFIDDARKHQIFPGNEHINILPLPMGYIAGSKVNVHYCDKDDSVHFWKNLGRKGKQWEYDWCWIGTETSTGRKKLVAELESIRNDHSVLIKNPLCEFDKHDEREKFVHADNKAVPYAKFKEYHLKSKVGISCNGMGMWCYKDAELMAWNVFCLRQWHKNLNLCPLSPKDGKHWVVFNGDLKEKLGYYVKHDDEREEINDAGHKYFRDGIMGGWAKIYVDALIAYKKTENRKEFGELLWKPSS